MIKVIVWNSDKLAKYYNGSLPTDTYAALVDHETRTGDSLSSAMRFNSEADLGKAMLAIYNETDVDLEYEVVK